jgi:hypothetical protein
MSTARKPRKHTRRGHGGFDPHNLEPVSWPLPDRGEALKLVATDYETAGRALGVEAAAVHAVGSIESGGRTGFERSKRPKIRYENHYFQRLTGHKFDESHPDLSAAYNSKSYRATHSKGSDQWKLLRDAFAVAPKAAVQSVSWGMFQVMGSSYHRVGWTDLEQFVKDMFHSEAQHLRAFLGFCRANGLVKYLKTHDWASFAHGYNGAKYKDNAYDVKIGNAYKRFSR